MNFNRQDGEHAQLRISNRPKRVASVLVYPQMEDFGQHIGLPKDNTPILPQIVPKQQSALRNQIKKYRNICLFDRSLFVNHKENRENIQSITDKYENKSRKLRNSYNHNDHLKIMKLDANQFKQQEYRYCGNQSVKQDSMIPKSTFTTQNNNIYSRKPSAIKVDNVDVSNPLNYLPSIRGWENMNQSTRSKVE